MKHIEIGLQDEQLEKLKKICSNTGNQDLTADFLAGLLLNTYLRDDPQAVSLAEDLVARFKK